MNIPWASCVAQAVSMARTRLGLVANVKQFAEFAEFAVPEWHYWESENTSNEAVKLKADIHTI